MSTKGTRVSKKGAIRTTQASPSPMRLPSAATLFASVDSGVPMFSASEVEWEAFRNELQAHEAFSDCKQVFSRGRDAVNNYSLDFKRTNQHTFNAKKINKHFNFQKKYGEKAAIAFIAAYMTKIVALYGEILGNFPVSLAHYQALATPFLLEPTLEAYTCALPVRMLPCAPLRIIEEVPPMFLPSGKRPRSDAVTTTQAPSSSKKPRPASCDSELAEALLLLNFSASLPAGALARPGRK